MILRGPIAESLLTRFLVPPTEVDPTLAAYSSSFDEIRTPFGLDRDMLREKTIVDFGCGYGRAALEAARMGAGLVVGVDIREDVLAQARQQAMKEDLGNCVFVNGLSDSARDFYGIADVVVSIDAFEHYGDPDECLAQMARYLSPEGRVYISFGPPWWHPYGAHLQFMTRLPWAHVFFAEPVLLKARAGYKSDGARRFEEVEGGLNRMSIKKFTRIVARSPFALETLRLIPIRRTGILHRCLPATRELLTSVVKAVLIKKPAGGH